MRLFEIHNTIPIIESIRTDFYDMYLLSSVQHSDDPDVEALLTDRVDRLIDHFRSQLYEAFILRIDNVIDYGSYKDYTGSHVYNALTKINDVPTMLKIIKDVSRNGNIVPEIIGATDLMKWHDQQGPYGDYSINGGNWVPVVEIFFKFCNPPNNTKSKVMLLDELFGLAHNSGPLTDYIDQTGWLFDALYTKALAHPNELAKHASHDARQAAKSGDIGYGLGSSLSSYKPVTDTDKMALNQAKQERARGEIRNAQRLAALALLSRHKHGEPS